MTVGESVHELDVVPCIEMGGKVVHKTFGDLLSGIGPSHPWAFRGGAHLAEGQGYPPRQKDCVKMFHGMPPGIAISCGCDRCRRP